ncbi:uncharacterized protein LOC142974801 [Anticarsia gemmatalis]|uniref:uncharacterized protein LOC142974801 n=1 Tax=Anticarsia gemmatalis TaxID=129554 RepID=UPI003F76E2E6
MQSKLITVVAVLVFQETNSVRLHKIFQFIDGYKSEHNLKGFLHVGDEYAVFVRAPSSHDKYITYELYEANNIPDHDLFKPNTIAITKVPIEYIKEQLTIFRNELYKAKYVDDNVVPGTQVKTLREWQIERALSFHKDPKILYDKLPVMRTVL